MTTTTVTDGLRLASSLDPQLGCVAARGWGRMDKVCEVSAGSVVESGEVRLWAVRMMNEAVTECSDEQLVQNCSRWRTTLVTALQTCCGAAALREVSRTVASLISRAHRAAIRDFSVSSLPSLLSSLLRFQQAAPSLQAAVLPCLSTLYHHYPAACKPQRTQLLHWGKEGLMNSDPTVCRESARLLVATHSSPNHWIPLLSSSLSTLTSSLLHFSHTLTQLTPPPPNFDLPSSEPNRCVQILRLITSHCRLLSYLLLSPPTSPVTLPLSTLVGVVSLGLHINCDDVITMATDSTLLLTVLPTIHSSLLTVLRSLIMSSHSHLLPFTTIIDDVLLCQLSNEGGVVWRGCVHGALCAWVKVRGEGGKGDMFSTAVIQWLLQSGGLGLCAVESSLNTLYIVLDYCRATSSPHIAELVWQSTVNILTGPSSVSLTLAGVKLLQRCLEYPDSTLLSTAVRLFQSHTHHSSNEVCEESRRGLGMCSVLLHPVGPPWITDTPTRGTNIEPTVGPPWITDTPTRGTNIEPTVAPPWVTDTPTRGTNVEPLVGPPFITDTPTRGPNIESLTTNAVSEVQPSQAQTDFQHLSGNRPPAENYFQDPHHNDLSVEMMISTGERKRRRMETGSSPGTETGLGTADIMTTSQHADDISGDIGTVMPSTDGETDREGVVSGEMRESWTTVASEVMRERGEVEGGEMKESGVSVAGEVEGGEWRGDSSDSNVDDIIASFCSSPSRTDSDDSYTHV